MHAESGYDPDFIWNDLACTIGNLFHARWWRSYNEKRKMSAFGKVSEIHVCSAVEESDSYADLIV